MAKKVAKYDGFSVINPDAVVRGETVSQWTENYSKWWHYNPFENNPVTDDPTGAYACLNNDDKVFYLPGSGGTDTRTYDVPFGKPVLLPILNITYFREAEGSAGDFGPVDEVLDWVVNSIMKGMYARIDGQDIANIEGYRVTERDFTMTATPGSFIEATRGDPDPEARGPYASGTDGYWLVLDTLSEGEHTLESGGYFDWNETGELDDSDQVVAVTATINVVKNKDYVCDLDAGTVTVTDVQADLLLA